MHAHEPMHQGHAGTISQHLIKLHLPCRRSGKRSFRKYCYNYYCATNHALAPALTPALTCTRIRLGHCYKELCFYMYSASQFILHTIFSVVFFQHPTLEKESEPQEATLKFEGRSLRAHKKAILTVENYIRVTLLNEYYCNCIV